jgi:hypothetical protein
VFITLFSLSLSISSADSASDSEDTSMGGQWGTEHNDGQSNGHSRTSKGFFT